MSTVYASESAKMEPLYLASLFLQGHHHTMKFGGLEFGWRNVTLCMVIGQEYRIVLYEYIQLSVGRSWFLVLTLTNLI
jgi:hypothetical protein